MRRSGGSAGLRLLQNQCFSISFASMLALTGGGPATASMTYCWVSLLQNQCFSIGFKGILALTGGAACDCVHRLWLGCVQFILQVFWILLGVLHATAIAYCRGASASKSMFFHKFYKHFASATAFNADAGMLGYVCFEIHTSDTRRTPARGDGRGRRQHPSKSQNACNTNGKGLILKQSHLSQRR